MNPFAGWLVIVLLLFAACKKNTVQPVQPVPPVVTPPVKLGAIKGSISPADAAVRVVCTPANGGIALELASPGSSFKLTDVAAGSYSVSVVPKSGYTTPASVTVTVTAGDTANAGTFTLAKLGAIKGSISPANAAAKVVCTPTSGGAPIELANPGRNFKLTDVAAGSYAVSVVPKLGYAVPAGVTVTVPAGDTANTGTFTLTTNGIAGSFLRFTMDATLYDIAGPDVSAAYASNTLTIFATTTPNFPYWTFYFNLANVTGPGTYTTPPISPTNYIEATNYLTTATWMYTTKFLNSNPISPSGSGTVTVSELNTVNRVITGTFSAVLPLPPFAVDVKRMTNGSFRVYY